MATSKPATPKKAAPAAAVKKAASEIKGRVKAASKALTTPTTTAASTTKKATPVPTKKASATPAKKAAPAAKAAPTKKAAPAAKAAPTKKAAPAAKAPAKKAAPAAKAPAKKAAPVVTAPVAPTPAPPKKAVPAPAPAKPKVNPYLKSPKFLDQMRTKLLEKKAAEIALAERLRAEANALTASREAGDDTSREDEGGDGSTFAVDRADLLFNAEQMMATVDEINEALWRMDRGTWGMCTSCGDPIMKARLEYWPEASMCVECKQGGLVRR